MDFALNDAVPVLARTPAVLRTLLAGLDRRWTHADYGEGTWSPAEVVAHLIFGERTDWIPRARIILEHGESRPLDPFDRAGHKDLLAGHSLDELLTLFERERHASLAELQRLNPGPRDLERTGIHPRLGRVTLSNLLATWVAHDLNHIHQICKGMAFQYEKAVGPWTQFLSILAPPAPR